MFFGLTLFIGQELGYYSELNIRIHLYLSEGMGGKDREIERLHLI